MIEHNCIPNAMIYQVYIDNSYKSAIIYSNLKNDLDWLPEFPCKDFWQPI